MSKHTPGPWKVDGHMISGHGKHYFHAKILAGDSDEQCDANARLIAAAPENFECNQELAAIVRELCGAYGIPLPAASLARSDAAIAKATGAA